MPSSETPSAFRLNPLAFPAETDMRFLLLLLAAAGTTVGLADFAIYVLAQYLPVDDEVAKSIGTISAFVIMALVFILTHRRAKRAASRLIASERWSAFPPQSSDPLERASLERMRAHVDQIVAQLPGVARQPPRFYWNDTSEDSRIPAGMTFGYRGEQYVCLNDGLHAAFLSTSHPERFHSVLLHELGHIANRDVSRTTFSIELGRIFTQIALVLAMISEGYLIFHLIRRFLSGKADQADVQGIGIVVQTAVGAALVIGLIEIIRASVLRAREYYADARARQWLGSEASLIDVFNRQPTRGSQSQTMTSPAAIGIVPWSAARLQLSPWKLFRKYLAPVHPRHARRIDTLKDPRTLFEVDLGTAFVAGLLSGLALNANSLVLNLPVRFGGFVNTWLSSSLNLQMSGATALAIVVLSVLLSFLAIVMFVALFAAFFLAPLVGTVGVMVQRAAFADRIAHAGAALLPLRRLVILALLVGVGIVLGGTLTPAPGALSLQNRDWLLAPIFVFVWASVVFVWLLPLRWLAARAYRSHVGANPPVFRRRCIAVVASLAIAPLALFTMLGQGTATTVDGTTVLAEFVSGLLFAWLLSLPISFIIWGASALLMWLVGWFGPARCPMCHKAASHTKAITLHCSHCGHALKSWAVVPAPMQVPQLPPLPNALPSDAPPPL